MLSNRNGHRAIEHDDQELVLTNYGAGYAWLRPNLTDSRSADEQQSVREPGTQEEPFVPCDQLPRQVFDVVTRYVFFAPTRERAERWFEDENDIGLDNELVEFREISFVATLPNLASERAADGEPADVIAQRPQREAWQASRLQRFAACWHSATRPVALVRGWRWHAEGERSC